MLFSSLSIYLPCLYKIYIIYFSLVLLCYSCCLLTLPAVLLLLQLYLISHMFVIKSREMT